MNNKAIIFGCGVCGIEAYHKLKNFYEIVAWSDNNQKLWKKNKEGIFIVAPVNIVEMQQKERVDIFVCMESTDDVVCQLKSYRLENIYIWKKGFFFSAEGMVPLEFSVVPFVKESKTGNFHVLFVSDAANARDHKMARLAKESGCHVYLAYLIASPEIVSPEYADIYEKVFPVMSIRGLVEFIKNSEFDLIHSSSEPDYLTPVMAETGKTVIHDCHDLRSSNREVTPEMLMVEYLAHKESAGVIYPAEGLRNEAVKKFDLPKENTLVIENFIARDLIADRRKEKKSLLDGEIHCVYEGGVSVDDASYKYYCCYYWRILAEAGLHIHFYTRANLPVCRVLEALHENIHYEGNISPKELSVELSQYDVGLCIFNVTKLNKHYLEMSSSNKLYEYINAGLPVAVNDVACHRKFVEGNNLGKCMDWDGDLYSQIKEISRIKVPPDVLQKQHLVFDDKKDDLLAFYIQCKERKGGCVL